eukprot:29010_1
MCLSEDSIPLISQLKSLILLFHCDRYGSLQTQIAFSKQFIIISQIRSLIQWLFYNDIHNAKQTQIEFYHESILTFPILSQLISIILLLCCDPYSAWRIQQKCLNKLTNLIFLPIRFIYYIFNYHSTISRQLSIPTHSSFTTWMGDNFTHIPLDALTLIGTHNAHSYKLRKHISFFNNFACCQNLSIYRQLISGSRCLDIRLCNFNDNLWCAHSHYHTITFMNVIRQTLRFIKQYPSEIIIFRCKTEWDWINKPNNPVTRNQIIDVIECCDDARKYCAPLRNYQKFNHKDILSINIGELAARKWNIILFHEFEYGEYAMQTSWTFTQSEFARELIRKSKLWMRNQVHVIGNKKLYLANSGYGSVDEIYDNGSDDIDEEYGINIDNEQMKILYLVNGQITPVVNCKYCLFMFMTGFFGIGCDVELVNAEMIKNIELRELFKLNVWDMDFLHPLLVQKIIDANLKYCLQK